MCNEKLKSLRKLKDFPGRRKRAFHCKVLRALSLSSFPSLFFALNFTFVWHLTPVERFPDFANNLRQFHEADARRSSYERHAVLIATAALVYLPDGVCITERANANDCRSTSGRERGCKRGEEKGSPLFFRSTRIHPPGDASMDTSTESWCSLSAVIPSFLSSVVYQ